MGAGPLIAPARPVGAAAALVAALVLSGCGGSRSGPAATTAATEPLPGPAWVVSFDVRIAPAARLQVGLGYGGGPVTLTGAGRQVRIVLAHGGRYSLSVPRGWIGGGSWHIEATNDHLAVDGRLLPVPWSSAASISFRNEAGSPQVSALIMSSAADRGALLLHRLAELHARIPPRQFPEGATLADRIIYGTTYWTNGFWAGALWQAAAMGPDRALFTRWALTATLQHFGQERADTHDVGFMYGESSLAAWKALCTEPTAARATLCARLKRSALSAAGELLTLAASNPGAGTIPTNTTSPEADTIVDSMMNIALLPWATQVTGDPRYAQLAAHHAREVERLLVRPNGSTAQAVNFDRRTGRVLSIGTHQGLSDHSTWSRGEGWAVYGFAQAAADLHDRGLLRVALRVAGFIASHLPSGGIPRWDYDAPAGASVDVSAGVISAAGLFHLAAACRTLSGVCAGSADRWAALGGRMLSAALGRAGQEPPLGLLRSQVLNEHGHGCWCNDGELIFGLTYGLEGVRLRAGGGI
jgi:unsaturated chondroitin disaccharide hydrolase